MSNRSGSNESGAKRSGCGRLFLILFILVLVGAGVAGGFWYLGPYHATQDETFVQIDHGMSTQAIGEALASAGVIRSPWSFIAVRAIHRKSRLQAGEYRFTAENTPFSIFDKIRRGQVFYEDVTIPEGSNRFDIPAIVEKSSSLKAADFLAASADATSIRDLDPSAPSLEGYLFPSTYQVTHSTTAKQLCHMMTAEFRREWMGVAGTAPRADMHEIVTLGSLVEKETHLKEERPMVAAVFANRLRLHMPLQCDPTTVYAALLENQYSGVIHKSDLASVNPYNTYAHAGLPPGPIANPGAASLKAALNPAPDDFLFFVARADGSGGHHFSATLAEHEKAVADFRKADHQ